MHHRSHAPRPQAEEHGAYHLTLVEALQPLDGITAAPWWATDRFARLCMQTGKPVCSLTVSELLSAWAQVGDPADHPKHGRVTP